MRATTRLLALTPRWWRTCEGRSGMGISFDCPHCVSVALIDAAPASPAVAAWQALTHEERDEVYQDLSSEQVLFHGDEDSGRGFLAARRLLQSLAPEAGDAQPRAHSNRDLVTNALSDYVREG